MSFGNGALAMTSAIRLPAWPGRARWSDRHKHYSNLSLYFTIESGRRSSHNYTDTVLGHSLTVIYTLLVSQNSLLRFHSLWHVDRQCLGVLLEEAQRGPVSPLILLAHLLILEVGASSHPSVDLGGEGLNIVGLLQVGTECLDILGVLVLGGQHRHGDVDTLGIVRVEHRWVALHRRLEQLVVLTRRQGRDLASPAVTQDRPRLEAAASSELVGLGDNGGDLGQICGRSSLGLEEVTQLLLVVVGLRREPGDVGRLALKEVGDEDAVLLLARGGQDVGTLDGLGEETENV